MADEPKKTRKPRKPSGPAYVFIVYSVNPETNELTIHVVSKRSDDVLEQLEGHSDRSYKKVEVKPARTAAAAA